MDTNKKKLVALKDYKGRQESVYTWCDKHNGPSHTKIDKKCR